MRFSREPESNEAALSATIQENRAPGNDLTTAPASFVEKLVAAMPLEQKIGQMMMVGFEGSEPDAAITQAIQDRHVGGVILFSRNIITHEQVLELDRNLQQLAKDASQPASLMIAIDQEGGKTRRFTDIGPADSQPTIGALNTADAVSAAEGEAAGAARELKRLGINTNLAPVVDVSAGNGTVMDNRSYGVDAGAVAQIAAAAVYGYKDSGVICSPKHFPGHGSADGDSEALLPTVSSDEDTITSTDLVPFRAVIQVEAPMIMVAHLSVPALDVTGRPASMSPEMITNLLRGKMNFTGVVITDDMEMGAVAEQYEIGDAAVKAVAAGADIILVAHTALAQQEAYEALLNAVSSGSLPQSEIDKAVIRILEMKKQYGLLPA